jgi:hypothetical protein
LNASNCGCALRNIPAPHPVPLPPLLIRTTSNTPEAALLYCTVPSILPTSDPGNPDWKIEKRQLAQCLHRSRRKHLRVQVANLGTCTGSGNALLSENLVRPLPSAASLPACSSADPLAACSLPLPSHLPRLPGVASRMHPSFRNQNQIIHYQNQNVRSEAQPAMDLGLSALRQKNETVLWWVPPLRPSPVLFLSAFCWCSFAGTLTSRAFARASE